jgi:hypothetical protein
MPCAADAVRERPATWLLDRSDYAWMLVLVALGLALRLAYWSATVSPTIRSSAVMS